ncbi:hypothetical protein GCM10009863_18230 [Streptomyces axinellae]|uniref:OmpR/PhoB-type domain-containing protein n=1 Tax=Streptomyces axinellae TaxID=552788 RepID=A0ABN3PVY3_9ACTN
MTDAAGSAGAAGAAGSAGSAVAAGSAGSAGSGRRPGDRTSLLFGDLAIDTAGLEVSQAGEPVAPAPTEPRLLLEFAANPGIVLDRRTLLRNVWDYGWDGDSRLVGLCVQRLRRKIGAERIQTVRGFGYKLRRRPAWPSCATC